MDTISLLDITVYGCHGVSDEEQALGRPFLIDLEVQLDLRPAGDSDDLGATVNYAALCEVVREVNEEGPFRLLEAFAERIANEVLEGFPVSLVTVRVRKPHPPVGMLVGAAQVEITRKAAARTP